MSPAQLADGFRLPFAALCASQGREQQVRVLRGAQQVSRHYEAC